MKRIVVVSGAAEDSEYRINFAGAIINSKNKVVMHGTKNGCTVSRDIDYGDVLHSIEFPMIKFMVVRDEDYNYRKYIN